MKSKRRPIVIDGTKPMKKRVLRYCAKMARLEYGKGSNTERSILCRL
jgi:hypothetical protein